MKKKRINQGETIQPYLFPTQKEGKKDITLKAAAVVPVGDFY
jgi:hypothetical protein